MHRSVSDTNEPSLRVRTTSKEPVGRRKSVISHFEVARMDVNRYDSSEIALLYLPLHLFPVDRFTPLGCFVFTVVRPSHLHVFLLEKPG